MNLCYHNIMYSLEKSMSWSLLSFHLKLLSLSVHACSSTFCIRESWLIFFYQINEARMWNTAFVGSS
jgi:hypothetical protein